MAEFIVVLIVIVVLAFIVIAVVGVTALLLGPARDVRRKHFIGAELQVTKKSLATAQAQLKLEGVNSKRGKAYRDQQDRIERAQFAIVKARSMAADVMKVTDTAAAHLAGELDE